MCCVDGEGVFGLVLPDGQLVITDEKEKFEQRELCTWGDAGNVMRNIMSHATIPDSGAMHNEFKCDRASQMCPEDGAEDGGGGGETAEQTPDVAGADGLNCVVRMGEEKKEEEDSAAGDDGVDGTVVVWAKEEKVEEVAYALAEVADPEDCAEGVCAGGVSFQFDRAEEIWVRQNFGRGAGRGRLLVGRGLLPLRRDRLLLLLLL